MENTMDELSTLSRTELVGALLAPLLPADDPRVDRLNDHRLKPVGW